MRKANFTFWLSTQASVGVGLAVRDPVQGVDDSLKLLPQGQTLPAVEIKVHRCPGRKLRRQLPPLATRAAHVEQGVEYGPQTQVPAPLRGQQRLDNLPLRVSKELIAVNRM